MLVDQPHRALLGKAGFTACRCGMLAEARTIFDGLRATAPEQVGPVIGQAFVLLAEGKCADAQALLEKDGLALAADDPEVKAYMGLACHMDKRPDDARTILEDVVSNTDEGRPGRALAESILAELP